MTTKSLLKLKDKRNLQAIKAKFTHGIFTPLKPLKLKEGDEVFILLIGQDKDLRVSEAGTGRKKRESRQGRASQLSVIKRKMKARTGLNKAERRIAIKAGFIDKDQEWFWTPEWQAGEKEADEDERLGRTVGPFDTADEAIHYLHSLSKKS